MSDDEQDRLQEPEKVRVLPLSGLGAEIWRGVDALEYVSSERSSWHER